MHQIITIKGITIAAPPGAFAYVHDDQFGWWVTDLGEAQLLALVDRPNVDWVGCAGTLI